MNTLGSELKILRSKKQWSQSEAAKLMGIEQSFLSKLESDQSWASIDVLKKICKVYNMKPAQLLSHVSVESLKGNLQYQGLLINDKHRKQAIVTTLSTCLLFLILWFSATNNWIRLPGLQATDPNHQSISLHFEKITAQELMQILADISNLKVEGIELLSNELVDLNIQNKQWDMVLTEFLDSQNLKTEIFGGAIVITRKEQNE